MRPKCPHVQSVIVLHCTITYLGLRHVHVQQGHVFPG
jgi:hypothetical protein